MRIHCCSNAREKPTSPTNAPTAIPIPDMVRRVLNRRRRRFFSTKPIDDNEFAMKSREVLLFSHRKNKIANLRGRYSMRNSEYEVRGLPSKSNLPAGIRGGRIGNLYQ